MQNTCFNRNIDYLRISVTDRCNLRCIYCMPPEGIGLFPQEKILSFEEIIRLAKIFSELGVNKIRLTGGEPLARKEIVSLVRSLAATEGIKEVSLTTNGTLLSLYAEGLKDAGIKRINISLDTLREDRFKKITGKSGLYSVMEGIETASAAGFNPIKLNMVVMRGVNDDEIIDFMEFSRKKNLILRFIEFMRISPLWQERYFMPIEEVKNICADTSGLRTIGYKSDGPAEYYESKGSKIGFIKTSQKNCDACSRLRLTSTGELRLCLYQEKGIMLGGLLRKSANDSYLKETIRKALYLKKEIDYTTSSDTQSYMCSIGG